VPKAYRYAVCMPIDLTALIDPSDPLPRYQQIAARLRDAIDNGALRPGEKLPSEQDLMNATGVSRGQVREGIDEIVQDGLAVTRQGAGSFVVDQPLRRRFEIGRSLDQQAEATIELDVIVTRETATAEDARRLRIPEGTDILRRTFLQHIADETVPLQRSAMPWSLAGGTSIAEARRLPWPHNPVAELRDLGLEPTWVDVEVVSRRARKNEQRALRLETPETVFDFVRVILVGERPVEASRVIVPGSQYVLHYEVELDLSEG
jgi:GntR family transcriptional regulator